MPSAASVEKRFLSYPGVFQRNFEGVSLNPDLKLKALPDSPKLRTLIVFLESLPKENEPLRQAVVSLTQLLNQLPDHFGHEPRSHLGFCEANK